MKRCPCPCRRELEPGHDRCEDQADRNRRCQHGCTPECHRYDGHPRREFDFDGMDPRAVARIMDDYDR